MTQRCSSFHQYSYSYGSKLLRVSIFFRYSNHLEVWKLGTYGTNENGNVIITDVQSQQNVDKENDNTRLEQDTAILDYKKGNKSSGTQKLKITDKPVKLISVKSKKNKQIVSCALSPDGQFVAYSTDSDVRMLKLETVSNYCETTAE